jgi:hypothetical protein
MDGFILRFENFEFDVILDLGRANLEFSLDLTSRARKF